MFVRTACRFELCCTRQHHFSTRRRISRWKMSSRALFNKWTNRLRSLAGSDIRMFCTIRTAILINCCQSDESQQFTSYWHCDLIWTIFENFRMKLSHLVPMKTFSLAILKLNFESVLAIRGANNDGERVIIEQKSHVCESNAIVCAWATAARLPFRCYRFSAIR